MAQITTDSPLSRRIVRSFLHFLNSVELGPGVDAEGIEVARECLAESFKLNSYPETGDHDSLIQIFKSIEANKQCETSKSDVAPQPVDPSSSFFSANAQNHSGASESMDEDWIRGPHTLAALKDELCGQFFAALEKNHFFRTNIEGSDDLLQQEKASRFFNDALMEMERSGGQDLSLKNLAESLKSLGNKAMQSSQYPDAIELYNCAIALYEKSAIYYCNRAAAYTQINKYTEAIQDCLRSIEIDPNYSKAYSRLGLVYYAQGNYREAMDWFIKALQLDPTNVTVKDNIRVAAQKLFEQHQADQNQNSRSSQEFQSQSSRGSRSNAVPLSYTSFPFNPNNLANMFMNRAGNSSNAYQGSPPHERQDTEGNGAGEPEMRSGGNASVDFVEEMPEDLTQVLRSVMGMFSGAASSGQPPDQMNGRSAPH